MDLVGMAASEQIVSEEGGERAVRHGGVEIGEEDRAASSGG